MKDETVFVGSKPILNYVTALMIAFQRSPSVNIMARGRAISSAVDVVEVARRSFVTDINVDDITIGTERLGDGDDVRNVSTIAIKISKSGGSGQTPRSGFSQLPLQHISDKVPAEGVGPGSYGYLRREAPGAAPPPVSGGAMDVGVQVDEAMLGWAGPGL